MATKLYWVRNIFFRAECSYIQINNTYQELADPIFAYMCHACKLDLSVQARRLIHLLVNCLSIYLLVMDLQPIDKVYIQALTSYYKL